MKTILIAVLCVLGLAFPGPADILADDLADDLKTVENLLKERTEVVLDILKDATLDEPLKKKQIMDVVGPIIDFQLMAKLTLGKTNWGKLNENQQAEFVDLFVARLKKSYLDKSSMYCCVEIAFKPAFKRGNKVYVPIGVETKDNPLEMLYKFYSSSEGWKAYDVEVNGVSLIKSYQAQFFEVLKNGTPEDLLTELRKTDVE
jgi:phospholipid transport system substrate-binding protein